MAAHSLAARWKEPLQLPDVRRLPARPLRRVVVENIWRARHNLAPLPLPKLRTIEPVAREKIDPLLKLLASPDEKTREKAAADTLELGISALPVVREAYQPRWLATTLEKRAFTLLAQSPSVPSLSKLPRHSACRFPCRRRSENFDRCAEGKTADQRIRRRPSHCIREEAAAGHSRNQALRRSRYRLHRHRDSRADGWREIHRKCPVEHRGSRERRGEGSPEHSPLNQWNTSKDG